MKDVQTHSPSLPEGTYRTDKPTASVVMVTPDIAERWLLANVGNRKLKPQKVAEFARDMAAGAWQYTGEAIKFSRTGRLVDGQNRLNAVIRSGATVPMLVVRGLDDEAQRVMDTGAKRTSADDLTMHGEKHATILAAASRIALGVGEMGYGDAHRYRATNSEIADFVAANPDIRTAAAEAREVGSKMDCRPSLIAYAGWRLARIDEHEACAFFQAAATKVGLREGDPVIAMCDRFADCRRRGLRLQNDVVFSVIFRAWNYRREGTSVRMIRVNSSNGGTVPVPEPK